MKYFRNLTLSASAIALSAIDFSLTGLTQAPSTLAKPASQLRSPITFVQQWESKDRPDDRTGKGKRPLPGDQTCPQVDRELTAIVPARQKTLPNGIHLEFVQGVTTGEHLTFWFYVPYSTALPATLSLVQNGEETYTRTISLPGKPGVIGIQLPAAKASQLKLEQPYQWTFSVPCNPESPSINPTVFGLVKRVSNTPSSAKIESTANTPKQFTTVYDRTQTYAKDGIWYEALTLLGEQKVINPINPDANGGWTDLLKAVQLESLAQEPIVRLYSPEL